MKLLCDQMLGSLATWLRCFGFDTKYASQEQTDGDLLQQAQVQHQTLITRDKTLIQRADKQGIKTIPISTDDLDDQLIIVLSQIPIDQTSFFTRCLQCNTILQPVTKEQASLHLPVKVREIQQEFYYCPTCKKYYWKGSHYNNMVQKMEQLISCL